MFLSPAVLAALALTVAVATPGGSQAPTPLGTTRVTLMSGPAPKRGGHTEVVRQASRTPRNLVIVDRNATAEDLAAALALLDALRLRQGDSLSADFRARPRSSRMAPTWQASAYRQWLVEQLVRLRRAPERQVTSYGLARTVEITLPSPAGTVSGAPGKE